MDAFRISRLCFSYENGSPVLRDLNFSIQAGEYVALAGANGSGKSTLARILCGFLKPDSGAVESDIPSDSGSASEADGSAGRKAFTGMVFQSPRDQIVASTVGADTAFGPENLGLVREEIDRRVQDALELTGLLEKYSRGTRLLSGGELQKLACAGILALLPRVLVFDEATSMTDRGGREALLAFAGRWHAAGNTVIHVTHDRAEILRARRVLFLRGGCLDFDGSPAEFDRQYPQNAQESFSALRPPFPPSVPALTLKNISFGFPGLSLFEKVNLTFEAGSITAVTGKTGAGKTTLLELAAGLRSGYQGQVLCATRPVLALQESENALFEEFAADDVAYGLQERGVESDRLRSLVSSAMDVAGVPFERFADRRTFTLSGGEKRKLSIAGIIALDADVYLFDEPCAGLDFESRLNMLGMFGKLAQAGKTVVFSTHRDEEAAVAHRLILLENGAVDVQKNVLRPFGENAAVGQTAALLAEQKPLEGLRLVESVSDAVTGGFTAKDSPARRLSPVAKYLVLLAFMIAGIAVSNEGVLAALIVCGCVYAALARYPALRLLYGSVRILPLIVFILLMQTIFFASVPGDTVYVSWGFFSLTSGKLRFALLTLLHYYALFVPLAVFVYTADERDVLDGMRGLLSPLVFFRIPVRHAVLVTAIVYRFIPLLSEEAAFILKARLVRSGDAAKRRRGLFSSVRALLPVFIPLVLQTLRRADAFADALDARYYR